MAASKPRYRSRLRALLVVGIGVSALEGAGYVDWAEDELNVQFHAFQDTRDATILSPTIELTKDFTDRTTLRAKFGLDAISAASDSCVRCHRPGARDTRLLAGASVIHKLSDDTKLTVGAEVGHENFYQATTVIAQISKRLNKGNTTVAGGYSFSLNRPQLHPAQRTENQFASDAFASLTHTLTKTTVAQFGYEIAQIDGYQSSPFLRALINGERAVGVSPDSRTRQTLSARLRQALPLDSYLETDYRHYLDTWSIHSNSLQVGLSHYLTRQLLVNVSYRWYQQTGAFFFAPEYFGNPHYFTGDFRLQPFDSSLYGGRVVYTSRGRLLWLPEGAGLTAEYEFYRSTTGFQAAIFTGGVRIPLGNK